VIPIIVQPQIVGFVVPVVKAIIPGEFLEGYRQVARYYVTTCFVGFTGKQTESCTRNSRRRKPNAAILVVGCDPWKADARQQEEKESFSTRLAHAKGYTGGD
jgi:hypothetical protein